MTTAFEVAVEIVLRWEGGDSHRLDDPGGLTRFGIAQNRHPEVDVASLTRDDAIGIYRRDYWDALGLSALPGAIALVVFDTAVNMGTGRAVRLLQQACGMTGTAVDGVLGPVTRAAVWRGPVPAIVRDLTARRAYTYAQLSGWSVFGLGWMRRLLDVYDRSRDVA